MTIIYTITATEHLTAYDLDNNTSRANAMALIASLIEARVPFRVEYDIN